MDGIFWLTVADRCWIPGNQDWQQKCPFEGAVRAAMDYLSFSLHGKSTLPGGPTTTRFTNLSSCRAFEHSRMSLTHARPVFSCFLVLKLCCSSPDCVLDLFERCWTEWSHFVLSLPRFYCCLEQKNNLCERWKRDVEGVGICVGSRDSNRGNWERKRIKFPGKKINMKEEQERKRHEQP